jgi:hypothetical protein
LPYRPYRISSLAALSQNHSAVDDIPLVLLQRSWGS